MTRDQLLALPRLPPILLLDFAFGVIIRSTETSAIVQVPDEETAREVPLNNIVDVSPGAGALVELPSSA